jgi:hypothetical protein
MRLGRDTRGVESLPLKLIIVAVVATMSVVPAADALNALRDKDFLRRAEAQLEELVWTAEVVSLEGPGSSRTVVLDFSSDGGIRFDRLTVGDHRDGPNQTAVRLVLSTGSSIVRITDMPPVPMSGPDGGAVVVQSTTATMTVRCAIEDGVQRVLVEVA